MPLIRRTLITLDDGSTIVVEPIGTGDHNVVEMSIKPGHLRTMLAPHINEAIQTIKSRAHAIGKGMSRGDSNPEGTDRVFGDSLQSPEMGMIIEQLAISRLLSPKIKLFHTEPYNETPGELAKFSRDEVVVFKLMPEDTRLGLGTLERFEYV